MTKDLNILAAEVHAAAKEKGFWDAPNDGEKLMLIISELSEALEAHRRGRFSRADFEKLDGLPDEGYQEIFRLCVKDSFEDELADVVIRILDFCGAKGYSLPKLKDFETNHDVAKAENVGALFWEATKCIVAQDGNPGAWAYEIVQVLSIYASAMNIDLWKHIELKFKYNAFRPHKHGKAY